MSVDASLGRLVRSGGPDPVWYDTATNALLRIDPILAAVLPLYGSGNEHEVRERLDGRFPPRAVEGALDEIRRARREEGLFALSAPSSPGTADSDPGGEPGHLVLCLSERCNLSCRYCPQDHAAAAVMPLATAERAVDFYAALSPTAERRTISLYGGEPLLHMPVVAAVARRARIAAGAARPVVCVDTNATLIDDARARLLAREKVHLQVSLDGPPRLHDRWRRDARGRPTHAAVLAGLRRLLRIDPTAASRVRFVATVGPPYAFTEVAAYFADFPLYRELGIDAVPAVRLNTANLAGTGALAALDPEKAERQWRAGREAGRSAYLAAVAAGRRADLPRALRDLWDDGLIRWHHRSRGPEAAGRPLAGTCRPGRRRLFVAPDGSLRPCERVGPGERIGSLDEGIDVAAVRSLDARLADRLGDRCRRCWARRLCSVCFSALGVPGDAEKFCAASRMRAAGLLELQLVLQQEHPHTLAFLAESRVL